MAEHEAWMDDWQAMIDAVGTEFGGNVMAGADDVDKSAIRRFQEPLEAGCPIHTDRDAALAAGFSDVVAPVASFMMFQLPPMWKEGDAPIFTDGARNAEPARSAVKPNMPSIAPPTTAYFATDIDFEFLDDLVLGDHLTRRGNRLISCEPKRTAVGTGAFTKWEAEYVNQRGEVIGKIRTGLYHYNPHEVA